MHPSQNDPYQVSNLFPSADSTSDSRGVDQTTLLGLPISKVISRLDSLLFVLKTCKSKSCVDPWRALHPAGNVNNLKDALASRFDEFHEIKQKKIQFDRCARGYLLDAEGPQFENAGLAFRDGIPWAAWV